MLAVGYFSSKAFTGERFFIRNCRLSSSLVEGPLSCRPTFGDIIWFFIESFKEVLLLLLPAEVEEFWPV